MGDFPLVLLSCVRPPGTREKCQGSSKDVATCKNAWLVQEISLSEMQLPLPKDAAKDVGRKKLLRKMRAGKDAAKDGARKWREKRCGERCGNIVRRNSDGERKISKLLKPLKLLLVCFGISVSHLEFASGVRGLGGLCGVEPDNACGRVARILRRMAQVQHFVAP